MTNTLFIPGCLTRMEYHPGVCLFMVSLKFDIAPPCWPRICNLRASASCYKLIFLVELNPLSRWSRTRTWRDRPCSYQMQWSWSTPVEAEHFEYRWPYEFASFSPLALTLSLPWLIVAWCTTSTLVVWHLKWLVTLFISTSAVAKRLTSVMFSKSLDQAMTVNHHARLQVGFRNWRGYVNRTLITFDFCVGFMSPPCLARDSGIGDSSCFRIVPISTVRHAVTALSNRCRNSLLALTVFCTLYLVDTVAMYSVAKVFERCFLSMSWNATAISIRRCFTLVITCSFRRSSALRKPVTTSVGAESLDAIDTKGVPPLLESMSPQLTRPNV